MKKLAILTLVAIAMTSLTGCRWPRSMCRGDSCAPTCGPYEGAEMGSPALMAPGMIQTLPGPATTITPGP